MKKLIAIFFMLTLLFSLAGKLLLVDYFITQNNVTTVKQIDIGNYTTAQLVEIKVPLRVPYYSSSMKYERYYGDMELDGKYYNYVMRKVINDTVYLLCLVNHTTAALNKTKADYASAGADSNSSSSSKKGIESTIKKSVSLGDYCPQDSRLVLNDKTKKFIKKQYSVFSSALTEGNFNCPFQPPETNSSYYFLYA